MATQLDFEENSRIGMKDSILNKVADVSRPYRHKLAGLLIPRIYYNEYGQRPMIDFISSQNKTDLVGVEVGVKRAENAEFVLKKLDIKMLYLVDSYDPQISKTAEQDKIVAFKRMKKHKNTKFIIADSFAAGSMIPEQVDFVYIDADHSYEGVLRDIRTYYPLVKKSGVIGGHDFYGKFLGVVTAVLDWTEKNHLKLHTGNFDWWVTK